MANQALRDLPSHITSLAFFSVFVPVLHHCSYVAFVELLEHVLLPPCLWNTCTVMSKGLSLKGVTHTCLCISTMSGLFWETPSISGVTQRGGGHTIEASRTSSWTKSRSLAVSTSGEAGCPSQARCLQWSPMSGEVQVQWDSEHELWCSQAWTLGGQ